MVVGDPLLILSNTSGCLSIQAVLLGGLVAGVILGRSGDVAPVLGGDESAVANPGDGIPDPGGTATARASTTGAGLLSGCAGHILSKVSRCPSLIMDSVASLSTTASGKGAWSIEL